MYGQIPLVFKLAISPCMICPGIDVGGGVEDESKSIKLGTSVGATDDSGSAEDDFWTWEAVETVISLQYKVLLIL